MLFKAFPDGGDSPRAGVFEQLQGHIELRTQAVRKGYRQDVLAVKLAVFGICLVPNRRQVGVGLQPIQPSGVIGPEVGPCGGGAHRSIQS